MFLVHRDFRVSIYGFQKRLLESSVPLRLFDCFTLASIGFEAAMLPFLNWCFCPRQDRDMLLFNHAYHERSEIGKNFCFQGDGYEIAVSLSLWAVVVVFVLDLVVTVLRPVQGQLGALTGDIRQIVWRRRHQVLIDTAALAGAICMVSLVAHAHARNSHL